jgi:hypothetical protein
LAVGSENVAVGAFTVPIRVLELSRKASYWEVDLPLEPVAAVRETVTLAQEAAVAVTPVVVSWRTVRRRIKNILSTP